MRREKERLRQREREITQKEGHQIEELIQRERVVKLPVPKKGPIVEEEKGKTGCDRVSVFRPSIAYNRKN